MVHDPVRNEAAQRALEMDAARSGSGPAADTATGIRTQIVAAIAAPAFWLMFVSSASTQVPLLLAVLLTAIPSMLCVGSLASTSGERWAAIGMAALFGQLVLTSLVIVFAGMAAEGNAENFFARALTFHAPLPFLPLAAFFGSKRGALARSRRASVLHPADDEANLR